MCILEAFPSEVIKKVFSFLHAEVQSVQSFKIDIENKTLIKYINYGRADMFGAPKRLKFPVIKWQWGTRGTKLGQILAHKKLSFHI
jgi:hypothetical protein